MTVDRVGTPEWVPGSGPLGQFGPGEPASFHDLLAINGNRVVFRAGPEANHQPGRKRPGLRGHVADRADQNASLLGHLTAHGKSTAKTPAVPSRPRNTGVLNPRNVAWRLGSADMTGSGGSPETRQ